MSISKARRQFAGGKPGHGRGKKEPGAAVLETPGSDAPTRAELRNGLLAWSQWGFARQANLATSRDCCLGADQVEKVAATYLRHAKGPHPRVDLPGDQEGLRGRVSLGMARPNSGKSQSSCTHAEAWEMKETSIQPPPSETAQVAD
jgi:hypothetical protein